MKIIQLSDLHLTSLGQIENGVNSCERLETALELAATHNPDHIVVSGDLCFKSGEAQVYSWLRQKLNETKIPYTVIPGNHDSVGLMSSVFEVDKFTFAKKIGDQQFLFMDTANGRVSPEDLSWLKSKILVGQQLRRFVFMHHPPCQANVQFMDKKHYLENYPEVYETLAMSGSEVHVFCGHYHVCKSLHFGNVHVHICPSTFFHIDSCNPEFQGNFNLNGFYEITIDKVKVDVEARYI